LGDSGPWPCRVSRSVVDWLWAGLARCPRQARRPVRFPLSAVVAAAGGSAAEYGVDLVRDACARRSRTRFAVDATAYPRPGAWCFPGREHVHNGACYCKGSSKTATGWECQFTAAVGHLRTTWAALVDVTRTVPATRTAQTVT
jgi:hypothetical protein